MDRSLIAVRCARLPRSLLCVRLPQWGPCASFWALAQQPARLSGGSQGALGAFQRPTWLRFGRHLAAVSHCHALRQRAARGAPGLGERRRVIACGYVALV